MMSWWRVDQELMKSWWRADEELMKSWWKTDEELMKSWWVADEEMIKSWWRADGLVWSGLYIEQFISLESYLRDGMDGMGWDISLTPPTTRAPLAVLIILWITSNVTLEYSYVLAVWLSTSVTVCRVAKRLRRWRHLLLWLWYSKARGRNWKKHQPTNIVANS